MSRKAYHYIGNELELFAAAINWKKYIAKLIRPFIKGKVLEVGAGIGTNTAYFFNDAVSSWMLLEPDEQFNNILNNRMLENKLPAQCAILKGYTKDLEDAEQFDCIIYIDVMEHIEKDAKEIERASRLLKKGGNLLVLSPAHNFLMSPFDHAIGHYRRYSKKSLAAAGNDTLKQTKIIYVDSIGFFASLINKVILRQKYPTKKQVHFWDNWMIPLSIIIDRLFFFKAGKTVIGIWKKK